MAVDVLWSLPVLMVLSAVNEVECHNGSRGLFCTNDFFNNVTCTWNQSSGGPGADCWVSGVKNVWDFQTRKSRTMIRSCRLKQQLDSVPGCSFVFENKEFIGFEKLPSISVRCNGTLVDIILNYHPYSHIKMQPPGAPNVNSTANDIGISWTPHSPASVFLKSFDFQVQVKQTSQTWEEATTLSTQQKEVRIPAQALKGDGQVRVRVKPDNSQSHWSSWSPTTTWVEAGDRLDLSEDEEWQTSLITMGLMLAVFVITVTLLRSCWTRGSLTGKPIPTPSKYFHTLHSVHGGNLKTWLNPLSTSQSVFMAQSCDQMSPVQVCEAWEVVPSISPSFSSTSALLHFQSYPSAGSDTSGVVDNSSSSSCFSNVGYFMSSCDSAQSEHSLAYFSYQDHFQNSPNLPSSLGPLLAAGTTHESLMWQPKSLDFGLPIREQDGTDMVLEEEEALDEQSSPVLIIPFSLPSLVCPPPPSPPPLGLIQTPSDSQQVELPVPADSSSSETWLVAGAMCRSSSMPVEPSKTGYLTLKELQMTFSNKSI
ncbi:interleukin-2 receptor subunit beta [Parambassis ranga]|uniref:Interleukin-2 receptor subunit beta n=1 Tax=Parambassis ranga TaxID=210632 RepID=A0A6P7IW20_9TELE|nr:interleukin-2 receptor subunit beta-like [Parambassis ranga]